MHRDFESLSYRRHKSCLASLRRLASCVLALFVVAEGQAFALQSTDDGVYVRVVDVGPGLCCVVAMPDDHYMIYDAGNYQDHGNSAMAAIRELIPAGSAVDLMVLSHSDSDHLAAVPAICQAYTVKRVLRDGFERPESATWKEADEAIREEAESEGCEDLNLKHVEVVPGTNYDLGAATATFVCGFYELPDDWDALNKAEAINARSIVVRLSFGSRSVIFCGDTVGRHIGDPEDTCIAAEKFMVDHQNEVSLDSDVMIAPHHGADNGSTPQFIRAISPEYVIFSAGHRFEHPREQAAERYLHNGVSLKRMFRTDLHDNEGGDEWTYGEGDLPHRIGTRHVEVSIKKSGSINVRYLVPQDAPAMHALAAVSGVQPPVEALREPQSGIPAAAWGPDSSGGSGATERDRQTSATLPVVVDAYVERNGTAVRQAGLGEVLDVKVDHLDELLADGNEQKKPIILYLDGRPLKNLAAYLSAPASQGVLRFALTRSEDSRDSWAQLLGQPYSHLRPTGVSVGLQGVSPVPSEVSEGQFSLVVFSSGWLLAWLVVFLAILIGFFFLASRSDLIRDMGVQPPDGARRPFSLARTQMAWWFFLVLGTYLLIGILTGDFATSVTSSVLVLLGISAATTLGAAAVDTSKSADPRRERDDQAVTAALQTDLATVSSALATPAVAADASQRAAVQADIARIESQLRVARNESRGFLWDVLSDADGVNFHRFQLAGWTLVLGIIFVFTVWRDLAMPSFSETLLALMGISSGTYLGLKIPESTSPSIR